MVWEDNFQNLAGLCSGSVPFDGRIVWIHRAAVMMVWAEGAMWAGQAVLYIGSEGESQ